MNDYNLIELLAVVGVVLSVLKTLPQILLTFKRKDARGLSGTSLLLGSASALFLFEHIILSLGDLKLNSTLLLLVILNLTNVVFTSVLLYLKFAYKPKEFNFEEFRRKLQETRSAEQKSLKKTKKSSPSQNLSKGRRQSGARKPK